MRMHGVAGCTVQKVTDFDLDNVSTFTPDVVLSELSTNDLASLAQVDSTYVGDPFTGGEIQQYIGILLMMGIFKLPQYRLYWSSKLSVLLLSNAFTVNCFDKIKHLFHCNDNTNIPQKNGPNGRPLILLLTIAKKFTQRSDTLLMNRSFQQSADQVLDNTSLKNVTDGYQSVGSVWSEQHCL